MLLIHFQTEAVHGETEFLMVVLQIINWFQMRGFKVVVRLLPHEVADMEPVLTLIDKQDPADVEVHSHSDHTVCLIVCVCVCVCVCV